jgi:superfamily II DNA or RNA helicase
MRLVDSSRKFRVVYSIYNHEYLGCLFSSHVVQELDNGSLSLSHQALMPENMSQFDHMLDDADRKAVRHLDKLTGDEVVKKFGGTVRNIKEFFSKRFHEEVKATVLRYVDRLMLEAIPLLRGKELFISSKDGYPARSRVNIVDDLAAVRFCFRRTVEDTRYFPLVYRNQSRLSVCRKDAALIVEQPAWLLLGNELFTFDQHVDGKKLYPFFNKPYIAIPKSAEDNYFRKFAPQIIGQYEVDAEGMRISYVRRDPKFKLVVDGSSSQSISMELRVNYGPFELLPEPGSRVHVVVEHKDNDYAFYKIFRNADAERDVVNYMERLQGGIGVLSMGMMSRQAGLQWLSENVHEIVSNGIDVVQDGELQNLTFERPQIVLDPVESGDWFDIKAVVHIAGFKIPFIKFRKHILQGRRDYVLPNGATAILPEEWFTDYRHLLEIAEERDDETIAIRKYQAVVLDLPIGLGGGLRQRIAEMAAVQEIKEYPIPDGLRADLRLYQKQGYNWLGFLQEHNLGGILADDMGLGKTLQTLSLLQREKENGEAQPSLVVMPTSLIYNWVAEARRFTPSLRILIHTGAQRNVDPKYFALNDVVLTTYGLVRQDVDMLGKFPWHYLILDESQMIKNPGSKTARAVKELMAKHRLSLTGTPVENTLMDLWSQMTFLNPGLLGSETFFRDFYIQPIEKFRDVDRTEKLRKLIHPFILRRTKTQVATELPPKVEQVHFCEMTEGQKKLYEETKNAYRNYLLGMDEGDFGKKKLNILAGLQKLRQIAIHPHLVEEGQGLELSESGKFQEYERLLDEVISKGAKVLVFSQFVRLLKILREDLTAKGIAACYLDGGTVDRQGEVQRFQNDPDVQVFLISLKAGGVGLNLTAAEYVFILDPWWNPAVERQAIDRSHRIGQTQTVFSYKFITKDSIEEKIIQLQQKKFQLSEDVISVEKELFKQLDMGDLVELLQ